MLSCRQHNLNVLPCKFLEIWPIFIDESCQASQTDKSQIAQSSIPSSAELFTAYLGSALDKNDPDHGESFYTFGFIDEGTVKSTGSEIKYTPVDKSNGFWQVSSSGYSVNDETFHATANTAIIDTGTTLALVDDQACKNIYAMVPGAKLDRYQGGYVFPTNTPLASLPAVSTLSPRHASLAILPL